MMNFEFSILKTNGAQSSYQDDEEKHLVSKRQRISKPQEFHKLIKNNYIAKEIQDIDQNQQVSKRQRTSNTQAIPKLIANTYLEKENLFVGPTNSNFLSVLDESKRNSNNHYFLSTSTHDNYTPLAHCKPTTSAISVSPSSNTLNEKPILSQTLRVPEAVEQVSIFPSEPDETNGRNCLLGSHQTICFVKTITTMMI